MIGTGRLRVLHVSARFLPDLGGVETHVYEVTRRLADQDDLQVSVLATSRSPHYERRSVTPDGVHVQRCRSWPRTRDYYAAPGIVSAIRSGGWDVVHVQGIHTLVPPLAMLAARSVGVPYVVTFHTGGHSSPVRTAARDLQWRALTPLLRSAHRLVAVGRFEQRLFADATGLPQDRFAVIRNGGALPPPEVDTPVVPGRIVSVGRLERYKGHHRLIEALPELRRRMPNAHAHILGAGPYEGDLRRLAWRLGVADAVTIRLVPPGDRAAMARALRQAQVMTALSDYEAHPVAVMEALTLGVPVLGLTVAGIGDLVEDGAVTGVSPDCGPRALAAAIATAASRSGDGRRTGVHLPTWDEAALQLGDLYRQVAATDRRTRPGILTGRPATTGTVL